MSLTNSNIKIYTQIFRTIAEMGQNNIINHLIHLLENVLSVL